MSDDANVIEARDNAIERLTKLFGLERRIYLAATVTSLAMLLCSAAFVLICEMRRQPGAAPAPVVSSFQAALGGLFGSSGLIAYSTSRLLRMWDVAMRILAGASLDGKGG